jgi:hypothetical protein
VLECAGVPAAMFARENGNTAFVHRLFLFTRSEIRRFRSRVESRRLRRAHARD